MDTPSNLTCKECAKTFETETQIKAHLMLHELSKPEHQCKVCGKGFKTAQALVTHSMVHSFKFSCRFCKQKFRFEHGLQRHFRRTHKECQSFFCETCTEEFGSSKDLESHLCKERDTSCDDKVEGVAFDDSVPDSNLKNHNSVLNDNVKIENAELQNTAEDDLQEEQNECQPQISIRSNRKNKQAELIEGHGASERMTDDTNTNKSASEGLKTEQVKSRSGRVIKRKFDLDDIITPKRTKRRAVIKEEEDCDDDRDDKRTVDVEAYERKDVDLEKSDVDLEKSDVDLEKSDVDLEKSDVDLEKSDIDGFDDSDSDHKRSANAKKSKRKATKKTKDNKSDDSTAEWKCQFCQKPFRQKHNCQIHERTHSMTEKPFKCEECGEGFTRGTTLRYHLKRQHGIIPPPKEKSKSRKEQPLQYMCRFCSKLFRQLDGMKLHERIHTNEKPFTCKYCPKQFFRKLTRDFHVMKHEGKNMCQICHKNLSSPWSLQIHMQGHDKQHMCHICGTKCSTENYLSVHMEIHKPEGERCDSVKLYLCSECPYTAVSESELRKHSLKHTGEKPYECEKCGRKYTRSNALKEHRLLHCIGKPHSCEVCGCSFLSRSSFRAHVRNFHAERASEVIEKWQKGLDDIIALMNDVQNECVDDLPPDEVFVEKIKKQKINKKPVLKKNKTQVTVPSTISPQNSFFMNVEIPDTKVLHSSDYEGLNNVLQSLGESSQKEKTEDAVNTILNVENPSQELLQTSNVPPHVLNNLVQILPPLNPQMSGEVVGSSFEGVLEAIEVDDVIVHDNESHQTFVEMPRVITVPLEEASGDPLLFCPKITHVAEMEALGQEPPRYILQQLPEDDGMGKTEVFLLNSDDVLTMGREEVVGPETQQQHSVMTHLE